MAMQKKIAVDQAREILRTANLRATTGRIVVLQYLHGRSAPVSHAEVTAALETQGYESSTIFRALNELADAGLLQRMELGDHVWRYEATREGAGATPESHPHFLCVDCGSIVCLPKLDAGMLKKNTIDAGKVGEITEVLFKGHCNDCQ